MNKEWLEARRGELLAEMHKAQELILRLQGAITVLDELLAAQTSEPPAAPVIGAGAALPGGEG